MIAWLFLDLGGPIIADEPWSAYVRAVIREKLAAEGLSAPPVTFTTVEREVKAKRQSGFLRTVVRTVSQSEAQADRVWARSAERRQRGYAAWRTFCFNSLAMIWSMT
jgi:hypothetical protein